MDWLTTSTILRDLKDFQSDAWDRFVERFRTPIVSFAQRLGVSRTDAEEIAQESLLVFAQAYREGKYDPARGRLSHWLFGIVYRQTLSQRKKGFRKPMTMPANDDGSADFWARLPDEREASVVWDLEWEQSLLEQCLENVKREVEPVTFKAFELAMHDGRSAESVAEELGVPIKTVYNAKHRVLKRIREFRDAMESLD